MRFDRLKSRGPGTRVARAVIDAARHGPSRSGPVAALAALALVTVLGLGALCAQDGPGEPGFTGLASAAPPMAPLPASDKDLNSQMKVYLDGSTLQAELGPPGTNMEIGQGDLARPETYPWRLSSVVTIELATFMEKVGRELRRDVGDLETLEPATIQYLNETLPAELEARMEHIIVEQQLFTAGQPRFLAVDPEYAHSGIGPGGTGALPPYFYTDGAGALEVLRRLGLTLQNSLLAHPAAFWDIVTAILMSPASPVRGPLGHMLDPAHYPVDPHQDEIETRLGKEGLPRIVIGVGGYTIGALGILAYQLTKHGLFGYDLDFNRLELSQFVLKTDKYGFGWRIDTKGFGFDNVNAGVELATKNLDVSVLAGGKVQLHGGTLFPDPQATVLASYKILGGGGTQPLSPALALLAEVDVPFNGGAPDVSAGALFSMPLKSSTTDTARTVVVDAALGKNGRVSTWHSEATYEVHKQHGLDWFVGVGAGNEPPIGPGSLSAYDHGSYAGPGASNATYGYGFLGIRF